VNQFQDKIDLLKFPREWNQYRFEKVKKFYYYQFAFYLIYVFAQYSLIVYGLDEEKGAWTWSFFCIIL
jgi:hypothetical protein